MTADRSLALIPDQRALELARCSRRMRSDTAWVLALSVVRSVGMVGGWT